MNVAHLPSPKRGLASSALDLTLQSAGFSVLKIESEDDILAYADYEPHLMILESGSCDIDRALTSLRNNNFNQAVLVIGDSIDTSADRTRWLHSGADRVICGTLHLDEMSAEINALVRRTGSHASRRMLCGPIEVDPIDRVTRVRGDIVDFTQGEFNILSYLILNKDRAVRKDALYSNCYADPDIGPEPKIIDVWVCKIRSKLSAAGADGHLSTVWGFGYRLTEAPVDSARTKTSSFKRTTSGRVLMALSDDPASAADIAEKTGLTRHASYLAARQLEMSGLAQCERTRRVARVGAPSNFYTISDAGKRRLEQTEEAGQ